MICKKCGAEITKEMKFCGQCGAKVNESMNTFPVRETSPMTKADSGVKDFNIDSEQERIARHEKATQAPIFSIYSLLSPWGRRRRIEMLGMSLLIVTISICFNYVFPVFTYLFIRYCSIINEVKRLHDLNKSNFFVIIFVVISVATGAFGTFLTFYVTHIDPMEIYNRNFWEVKRLLFIIDFSLGLYLLLAPGTKGANRYGRSPEELRKLFQIPPQ